MTAHPGHRRLTTSVLSFPMDREHADEMLRKAIIDHAEAYSMNEPGELLTHFVVVAAWTPADYGTAQATSYTQHYPDGHLPHHIALGLLEVGKREVVDPDDA